MAIYKNLREHMQVTSKKVLNMVRAIINMKMAQTTMEVGKMIFNMEKENTNGLVVIAMMVNGKTET